ncbi:MAG: tRNA (5-methylaminomethyl-2-thiouridylate)-methyltransferase [Candidatus Cloacimonadales bacterium]|nr:tRNA (5-methylaminomethyl-2-thiouridylate)-methyltransferase [Candidatus Cloacimonadales bacterium]
MDKKYKCFALFSGGLDSMLAVVFMRKLGYEVQPIFFETPFFSSKNAVKAAEHIGFKLLVHDVTTDHLKMMKNPRYGFGKNMNPCIDCHGLMFREAGRLMEEHNVDFLISGEVLGQRPMSQRKDALNAVGKLSEVKDLLVRPLSQKLITDTLPIREGWVKKDEMLDIQGRGRHRQMEMAKEYGITEYQNPGGGCLLTDIGYSRKLKDLIQHDLLDLKYLNFLKVGRHFRLNENMKMIIGRNNDDNEFLGKLCTDEIVFQTADFPGPLGVVQSRWDLKTEEIEMAASLVLRYNSKIKEQGKVNYGLNFSLENQIETVKMKPKDVEKLLI